MPDLNDSDSQSNSTGVAIACYVLAVIFLLFALFGYEPLSAKWPPEIDGSVQKCLGIAFVLFLIPSVKEMNIAGVLSFKAAEEAKAEVREAKREFRELLQVQNSMLTSVSQLKQETHYHNYTGPSVEEGRKAVQAVDLSSIQEPSLLKYQSFLEENLIKGSGIIEKDYRYLGDPAGLAENLIVQAQTWGLEMSIFLGEQDEPAGDYTITTLRPLWEKAVNRFSVLSRFREPVSYLLEVIASVQRGETVPMREGLLALNVMKSLRKLIMDLSAAEYRKGTVF